MIQTLNSEAVGRLAAALSHGDIEARRLRLQPWRYPMTVLLARAKLRRARATGAWRIAQAQGDRAALLALTSQIVKARAELDAIQQALQRAKA